MTGRGSAGESDRGPVSGQDGDATGSGRDDPANGAGRDGDATGVGRDPSWYAILLGVLLLGGAAVAIQVADEAAANRLAGYAYVALAVGAFARLAEALRVGRRLRVAGRRLRRGTGEGVAALPVPTIATGRAKRLARSVSGGVGGAVRPLPRLRRALPDRSVPGEELRDGLRTAVGLVFVAGFVLVIGWTVDPRQVPSAGFLSGWILTLVVLLAASHLAARGADG